jgi:hypothetical protein
LLWSKAFRGVVVAPLTGDISKGNYRAPRYDWAESRKSGFDGSGGLTFSTGVASGVLQVGGRPGTIHPGPVFEAAAMTSPAIAQIMTEPNIERLGVGGSSSAAAVRKAAKSSD